MKPENPPDLTRFRRIRSDVTIFANIMAFANITGSPDVVLASFAPFASLTSLAPAAARVLQLAQQPAE